MLVASAAAVQTKKLPIQNYLPPKNKFFILTLIKPFFKRKPFYPLERTNFLPKGKNYTYLKKKIFHAQRKNFLCFPQNKLIFLGKAKLSKQ